ncbi:MAG: aldehyde dehydrogenase, partial [Bacteroidales bacterium]|nr:aldehyde dehydrogenase [Bacteroidales bacterium]
MEIQTRISSFAELGSRLPKLINDNLLHEVAQANPWFTVSETTRALQSWSALLTTENLTTWTNRYKLNSVKSPGRVLVIMAGNIPLVGFQDFLFVPIAWHRCNGKLS